MLRSLTLILLATGTLSAQLQLFVLDGDSEKAVGAQWNIGVVAVGDTSDTLFRVRNSGSIIAALTTLSISGTGFSLVNRPPTLAVQPGGKLDFTVRFLPTAPGSYSANLTAGSASVILRATATVAVTISVEEDGARRVLGAGSTVDFGNVERGFTATRRFFLENKTNQAMRVSSLVLSAASFQLATAPDLPISIAPGDSAWFDVAFESDIAGPQSGAIQIDGRMILLRANAVEPPLPKPAIAIELPFPASAQHGKLAVRFASPSRATGTGQVQIDFQPLAANATDHAIVFVEASSRTASFTISEGDTIGHFGSQPEIEFQTGTTAGTIIFTARLGDFNEQSSITIPPSVVGFDAARANRGATSLELQVTGFDNTRSASRLSFTFRNRNGSILPPGALQADASAEFQRYFSDSDLGGIFALKAVFPFVGDPAAIGSVEVEITNSAGTARSQKISF